MIKPNFVFILLISAILTEAHPLSRCGLRSGESCKMSKRGSCPTGWTQSSSVCPQSRLCCIQKQDSPRTGNTSNYLNWSSFCGLNKYDTGEQTMPTSGESLIVGGQNAQEGQFPWQVSVLVDGYHACGGALLNKEWVLTAAHCVDDDLADYEIVLGEHDRSQTSSTTIKQTIQYSQITTHQTYDFETKRDDIALIQISSVNYTQNIRPVCRPESTDVFDDMTCIVSGWGATTFGGTKSYILQYANVQTYDWEVCKLTYGEEEASFIIDSNICAGGSAQESCQGDSGGPLSCKIGNKYKLAGIVSWGKRCGEQDHPGVYTKVQSFTQWIDDTMSYGAKHHRSSIHPHRPQGIPGHTRPHRPIQHTLQNGHQLQRHLDRPGQHTIENGQQVQRHLDRPGQHTIKNGQQVQRHLDRPGQHTKKKKVPTATLR